ncbi:CUB domain-containing protein 1-like [Sebastes umbrosus]|uniref:CUB domain-containing protein 1-like n=1 Tax=Sebastes umbrosus TaxID=72105 RepID=UPI00189D6AA8|nr:CUB domain-containing protein 1-like [Sebastes umbrosus]
MLLSRVTSLLLLLTLIACTVSGVQKLTVTPDRGTTIRISSSQVKGCKGCIVAGRSRQCDPPFVLTGSTSVSVEFDCTRPQDVFSVEIVQNIECTTKSCNGHIIQSDAGSLPFLNFNRKFTWNLKASAPKALKIDFSNTGMRQINPSEGCPDRHSYTLQALQTTGKVAVGKYCRTGPDSSAQILNQGSFSLDIPAGQKLDNGQFQVSVGEEIKMLCKVDVSKMKGISLHLEKLKSASDCKMRINSVLKENVTVTSKTDLTFQDCLPEDVKVTATRAIECSQLNGCPNCSRLLVPMLPTCLPFPLRSMTWTFRIPMSGTLVLSSPTGTLKQSINGQQCNDSIIFEVAEDDGTSVGTFCPQGTIQKVQIRANVSVTVSGIKGKALRTPVKYVLNALYKDEISEKYIFNVSPKGDSPVFLATPGWPKGMMASSTVSWIVSVPPKMEARLVFDNISQPKCEEGHTGIKVQRVGFLELDYSRREDMNAESHTVSGKFYLNMSNCSPERGDFRVFTKITLQKSKNVLLTIILSVVAVLLVIFVIVLIVVCVVIRKKKKKLSHQVSIYNPSGTVFLPGQNGFPRSREDSESHVYASIDDELVYTDLLRKGVEMGIYEDFEMDRTFARHTDSQKPLVSEDAGSDDTPVGVYQQFEAPPLPIRPRSHGQPLADDVICKTEEQSEEERSPNLGPRQEPEGGN